MAAVLNFAGQFHSASQLLRWFLFVEHKETGANGCTHSDEIRRQICPAVAHKSKAKSPDVDHQLDSVLPCRTIRVGLVSDHIGVTADVHHTLRYDLGVFVTESEDMTSKAHIQVPID